MSAITNFLNQDGLNTLWSKIKTYISNNTVAKETGKGLSTNDFTAAYKSLLDSIDSTVGDTSHLVKNSAVNKAISDLRTQIGNLKTFNIKVVTELPTSGQESNVIYLIKHVKSSTDTSSAHTGATNIRPGAADIYDEYLWVAGDGKFEKIGETGEASAASNVTYNHSDSKLDATNVQQAIDEVNSISNFAKKGGVVNISINYNSTNTAEVLTLEQAIAKVPSKDRVLGFQGKFLSENGWKSYIFIGDSIADWTDKTKWNNYLTGTDVVQELGEADDKVMSQKAASDKFNKINAKLSKAVNYIILQWDTDLATTRKQVALTDRKNGLQISYKHPENGWTNERYIGTSISDTVFPVDNSLWEHIPNESDINNISSLSNTANSMGLDAVEALSNKSTISTPLLSKYTLFEFNKVKNIFANNEVIKGKVKSVSVYCAANSEQYVYAINNDKTYAKYLGKIVASNTDGWYDIGLDVLLYDEYIGVANIKTPCSSKAEGYPVGFSLSAKNTTALAEKDTYIISANYNNQYMWGIKVTRENYEPANLAANITELTEKVDGSVLSVASELKAGGYLLTGVYRNDWTDLKSTEPIEVKEGDTILFNKNRYYGKSYASVVARVDIDGTFIKSLVNGSAAWIEMPDLYIDFNGYIVITNWSTAAKSEYYILRGGVVNEVNTLKKEISTGAELFAKKLYANKNYISLGDSITKGTGTSKPYPSILAETLNMNLTNLANPGDPLHYAIEKWDTLESYNFDLITIALGVNNYLNTSFQKIGESWFKQGDDGTNELLISEVKSELSQDFRLAFNTLMFKVLSKCPTAKVMVFTPLHKRNDFKKNEAGHMLSDYVNVIKEGCNLWGVECIDMNQLININPTIDEKRAYYFPESEQERGLHPNIEAHKLMAKEIIKRLIV